MAKRAGEGGTDPVDGGAPASADEFGLAPGGDVPGPQVGQEQPSEGRDEIGVHVVAVAGERGGLEHLLLETQPLAQIRGQGEILAAVQAGPLGLQGALERCLGGLARGESATAQRMALAVGRGQVDSESPGSVP